MARAMRAAAAVRAAVEARPRVLGALAALYLLAPYTGIAVPVSRLSVLVSAALGVPGVTLLVLLDML